LAGVAPRASHAQAVALGAIARLMLHYFAAVWAPLPSLRPEGELADAAEIHVAGELTGAA
jgi:hypothetical protein